MKHTSDQDLLLLAHRSLGFVKSLGAHLHLAQCSQCKKRLAEFGSLSTSVASAMRVGLPAWKPAAMALQVKLLIGLIIVLGGVVGTEIAVTNGVTAFASGSHGETCKVEPMKVSSNGTASNTAPPLPGGPPRSKPAGNIR